VSVAAYWITVCLFHLFFFIGSERTQGLSALYIALGLSCDSYRAGGSWLWVGEQDSNTRSPGWIQICDRTVSEAICIDTYIHICACMYVYIFIHTYIHTHTHIYIYRVGSVTRTRQRGFGLVTGFIRYGDCSYTDYNYWDHYSTGVDTNWLLPLPTSN
jgi:hypothetical protein